MQHPTITRIRRTGYPYKEKPATHQCAYENCGEELPNGYEKKRWEDLYFCDEHCFAKYMGLEDA